MLFIKVMFVYPKVITQVIVTCTLRKRTKLLFLQLAYSTATLISAYSVIFQWCPKFGVWLGFLMQLAWIHYWCITGQVGIILLDLGLLLIYILKLIFDMKGVNVK